MKKIFIGILALAMSIVNCQLSTISAAPRSLSDAQTAANKFLSSQPQKGLMMAAKAPQLKLAYTATHADQPAFYVFNNGNNDGYVVVSADDNAREILGYSETGSFNEADMPENMRVWFQHYAEEIAWAAQLPTAKRSNSKAVKHLTAKRSISPVSPLLGNIKWNQDSPYNDLCPIDQTDNTRTYTGCVATAAAQIMRFWKHPVTGNGEHTNNWDNSGYYSNNIGKGKGSEYANFGATTYDWDNMLEKYTKSATQAQKTAVATLMYHVGISCDMTYGGDKVGGSGATTGNMAYALYTYFKYDKSLQYIIMDVIGYNKFEELFLKELAAGRPILMGGATKNNEGHEFVCDGVSSDGLFHINWGWGGQSDDYFALSALDPNEQGIGGANSKQGFSVGVEAVIGIQPDKGGSLSAPVVMIEPDANGNYDYKFSKKAALKSEYILFSSDQVYNWGPADVTNATVAFGIYNLDTTFVKAVGSGSYTGKFGDTDYQSISMSSDFASVPAGDYLMALVFSLPTSSSKWNLIGFYNQPTYRALHATKDSVYIGEAASQGNNDVDYAWAIYDPKEKDPWTLALTNQDGYAPYIQCAFKSGYKNKIAGKYDMTNKVAYWDSYYSEEDAVIAVSGTLKLKCVRAEDEEDFANYDVDLQFVGDDGNNYVIKATLAIPAEDADGDFIELKDQAGDQAIEEVSATSDKNVIKVFRNGVLLIETKNAIFDLNGAKIQ